MKMKLKSILAAALCAVGLTASALPPSPYRDIWSSTPDPQAIKDPANVIDWGMASRTFESFEAKHGKFLEASADEMIAAYGARIAKDPTDCEALICRAFAYLKKAGENEAFDRLAKEFGYTFDNDTMHFTGELIQKKGVTPEMNDVSKEVCDILLPLMKAAYDDLGAVPKNWKGEVAITPDVYPVDESVYFDWADVLCAKLALAETMCVLNMVKGFDVTMDSDLLEYTFNSRSPKNGKRGVQPILENNPDFFSKVRDQKAATEAGDWWASAATLLDQWDKAHAKRSDGKMHFFDWNFEKMDDNTVQCYDWLHKHRDGLINLPYWASPFDYTLMNGDTAQFWTLQPLFAGKFLREHFPEFGVGVKEPWCNEPLLDTLPDSTLCGIYPGVSRTYIGNLMTEVARAGDFTTLPPYTPDSASSVHAIWYTNMFELGFANTGNQSIFAWERQSPLTLLDPEFNVRGVTAVFTGWSFSGYPNGSKATWEGSEIPTPYTKESPMYKRRNVVATANFTIPKVTYLDFDEKAGKMAERTDECELVNAETTEFTTGKVYAVVRDITIANRITVWSTPESPAKLVLCDGATLAVAKGVEVDVRDTATNALVICGQALGTGTLEATSALDNHAGIGGGNPLSSMGRDPDCGIVTINGGTVMAEGGENGAGIGGGAYLFKPGVGGTVTINGGTVIATGGAYGAGIGGAFMADGGTVTINGGTVTATALAWGTSGTTFFGAGIGAGYEGKNHGTVKFGAGIASGVEAGEMERRSGYVKPFYMTTAEYVADHHLQYVMLPCYSLKVPEAEGYSYAVSYEGAQPNAVLADGTNTYAIATGATARVRFTLDEDHVWTKEPENNPILIKDFSRDTVLGEGDLPTVKFVKKGTEGNPWAVGYSTRDSVSAYTNGVGGLVVEGAGNMKDFTEGNPAPWGTGISEVEIGEDVTSIGARAFEDSQLGSVTIPASVTSIGAAAFFGSTSLSNVTVEAMTPPALGDGAFVELAEGYKICVPAGTGAAYKAAPGWSLYADSIVEGEPGNPGNPWEVGTPKASDVIAYTNGVGGLVIEGDGNMRDFDPSRDPAPWGTDITSVKIGEDVTGIGAKAFCDCTSLSNVTVKAMTPPVLGDHALTNLAENLTIYVPYGTGEDYKAAPGWSDFADSIVELPEPITAESDEFAVDLRTSVNLVGETTISNVAWSATQWGKVPETFTTVGYMNLSTGATGVFGNLSNIMGEGAKDAVLPAKDGEYVLTHSTGDLTSFVTFTVSGTGNPVGSMANPWSIGSGEGDTVVAYVTDDGELVIAGSGAMGNQCVENPPWTKGSVTSLTIGRNVTSIPDYAFFGYTELSNVTFATGAQLGSIGSHAFAACPNMEELEIPANVTNCGPAVIAGTPNVTVSADNKTFVIVDGVLCDIKSNKVISGLDAAVVTIPEGMVEIGKCAFSTNGALTSVTIPATMRTIGKDAFKGCANLTNVFVRATEPPTLAKDAFKDCNGDLTIYVPEGKGETYKAKPGWSDYAGKITDMKGAGTKTNPWTVGTGVTAYIENGTLHVEGFGAMEDFTAEHPAPWTDAASDIESVEIGKGVTKVGNCAFIDCSIDAPNTFTVDDEAHELNLLAFLTPDMGSTNTLATGVFRVGKSETGKSETAAGFGPKDSTLFYGSVEEALTYGDTTSMQVLTLADMVNREKAYLTGIAGETPYSKAMQDLLDEVFEKLDAAKNYAGIVAIHNAYADNIPAQAEKDKTHEIAGTDITWRVMDGTVVIEGEGEMPDFVAPAFTNGAPWDAYKGDISNATVAAGIESLGKAAFANCPTGPDKTVTFENPKAVINLTAFVSDDGSVTNNFTAAQILLPSADGGVTNAVKFLSDTDPDAPRYDSIAEAIEQGWVSFVTAYTLDGLKEMAETWVSDEAGPQPWTERVAAAVTNAIAKIEAAADVESVWNVGTEGKKAVTYAQKQDEADADLGGDIPGSDLSWKLTGDQLVISGSGAMPEALAPVPWSNSVDKVGTVVVGGGVTGLSKGLFTSGLTAPADTVIFKSKTATVPLDAFVSADGSEVNDTAAILFETDEGKYEAPCGWTDASDKTKTYGSYAEALADGATAVKPAFADTKKKDVEEQIEKAPAAIVEKVQPTDESGRFIRDPNGDLIDVATVVENVNTNGAEAAERIVANKVDGLAVAAQAAASESGCTIVTLTVDAQPSDPTDLVQEKMTFEMSYGEGFAAKFAEITLATNDVPVAEAKSVIEIHIPYVTKDRKDFSVTRLHDGKVEKFAEIGAPAETSEDLTFFVGEDEVVIWTLRFSLYAIGSTAVPGCTVNYDGMGAEGTMASDTFRTGIPTNLTANAFTAVGYAFQGWTTNGAGGRIVFADRAAIADPQAGAIYDLKAVWTAVPTTVGSYDDLKKALDQAAKIGKPVEIVLDGTITPPAGEALVIPATVDVKFSGDGKIGGLVFREGVSLFTDSVAEHSDVFAYVDEALTNLAGLVIFNGLPEENRPIDLVALTNAMEKTGYEPAKTPLNALVATGEGAAAMPAKWVDAASRRVYETLQDAIEAGEKAVTPDFGSEEDPVPPKVIVEEAEVAPGKTVTATMKNGGGNVSGAIQALGAEGLVDLATEIETNVVLDVTAKADVESSDLLDAAAVASLDGRATASKTSHYVDITLTAVAEDGTTTAIHELDETLAILIPWTFEPNHAYKFVRYHEGATKVFPETADADGEYVELDKANGLVTIHSKFFSDFDGVDFELTTVRITVPAAKSLPEGVKSITVKADGAAVQPTTTSGGMSTYEIAVGTPVEVDFEAKSGYAFPETGESTWTWTPEGGIPAGDKTFSADEIKPDKVRDPMPACVYRFRAHVYTTKGVAQNLRTSGSACAPGESSCVVMRGRDKTVIEGWLYQCECVCDGLGESAVIWDAYRKVPLSDAAFETQFLNVIGSRSTDAEWAWTFTGTAVYDSLREQDYELVGSGYGAFNPSAGICTSFSGAFAGTASASYDLVTKRTAATADCVCQPSQVLKCDAVDGVSFELERTAAFGQWKVKYDATASKAYRKGGRLTIPNFIR